MGFTEHLCIAGAFSHTELCHVSAHPAGAGVSSGEDEPAAGRVWIRDTHTAPRGTRSCAKQGAGQGGAMPAPPKAWLPLLEPFPAGIFPGILPGTLGPCLQPATCHQCPQHVLTRARARLPLLPPQPCSSRAPGPAAPRPPRCHPAVPRPPCHGHHSQPGLTWSPCHLDPGMSHTRDIHANRELARDRDEAVPEHSLSWGGGISARA